MSRTYSLFGLVIRSETELPELLPAAAAAPVDVVISLGAIPAVANEAPGLTVLGGDALLLIPDVGRYWIRAGREIVVEPSPGVTERNLRLYLLGSAIGAILHQRGLLPLHANAIEIGGRAVAFMGHSGAGKSTLAAWFHDRNFRVLADDVCVVTGDEGGRPLAQPGIPRLRLWREALDLTGRSAEDYEASFDDMDKYNVPTSQAAGQTALPLHHIYLLDRSGPQDEFASIRRLAGVEAADALIANTYRGGYLAPMGATKRHFLACLDLVRKAPVFSARRPWDLSTFAATAAALQDHAQDQIAAAASEFSDSKA